MQKSKSLAAFGSTRYVCRITSFSRLNESDRSNLMVIVSRRAHNAATQLVWPVALIIAGVGNKDKRPTIERVAPHLLAARRRRRPQTGLKAPIYSHSSGLRPA